MSNKPHNNDGIDPAAKPALKLKRTEFVCLTAFKKRDAKVLRPA